METLKKPDLNALMGNLQDAVAHAGAVHATAKDLVNAIRKHQSKTGVMLDAVALGTEGLALFNDLQDLTHPKL